MFWIAILNLCKNGGHWRVTKKDPAKLNTFAVCWLYISLTLDIHLYLYFFLTNNLGKESVGTLFVLPMVNCHPLSPSAMLRITDTFNSLSKCFNIDWWGKRGREITMKVMVSFTLKKNHPKLVRKLSAL